jgi:hypothetical protein
MTVTPKSRVELEQGVEQLGPTDVVLFAFNG